MCRALLGQVVLVGLRDLLPVGQHPAEDLGHRPLQCWRSDGRRRAYGSLRAATVLQDRRQPGGRQHDLYWQLAAGCRLRRLRKMIW